MAVFPVVTEQPASTLNTIKHSPLAPNPHCHFCSTKAASLFKELRLFLDNISKLTECLMCVSSFKLQDLKHLLKENKLGGVQAKVGVLLEKLPRCSVCGCAGHDIPAHRIPVRTSICQHKTANYPSMLTLAL